MSQWLFSFEAREIQRYILRSDKLKEMVGASELVNSLCNEFLQDCLDGFSIVSDRYSLLTAAAGGARILFNERADAERVAAYWPFLVDRYTPGLQVVQVLVEVSGSLSTAIEEAGERLRAGRNRIQATLPEVGPLVDRNPRTGLAAASEGGEDLVDRQSLRKREQSGRRSLVARMTGGSSNGVSWSDDLGKIAGSEKQYLAVIHADGNDLGRLVIRLYKYLDKNPAEAQKVFNAFSQAVRDAGEQSAHEAYEKVLKRDYDAGKDVFRCIAARPIVLGGDDMTMVVRADLAFDFTTAYLEAFEQASEKSIAHHLSGYGIEGLPDRLTACAGIAFVKPSYPFAQAYDIAEDLCHQTKNTAKLVGKRDGEYVPSSFLFRRVTTGIADEPDSADGCADPGQEQLFNFRAGPYAVGKHGRKLAAFSDLQQLADTLECLSTGTVRTLINTIGQNAEQAKTDYRRMMQVAEAKTAERFQARLCAITKNVEMPLWSGERQSPLLDAHIVRGMKIATKTNNRRCAS